MEASNRGRICNVKFLTEIDLVLIEFYSSHLVTALVPLLKADKISTDIVNILVSVFQLNDISKLVLGLEYSSAFSGDVTYKCY